MHIKRLFLFSKTTISAIILLFCTSCASPSLAGKHKCGDLINVPTKSFVKVFKKLSADHCKVVKKDKICKKNNWVSTGSGVSVFLVKGVPVVLTAGHVCVTQFGPLSKLENITEEVTVQDYKGDFHLAQVILSERDNGSGISDLCALLVPSLDVENQVRISTQRPKVGSEVYYMGAPAGVFHPPTVPIFKGIFSGKIDSSSALITAPATQGASGAPVLNKKNELIGILYAVHPRFHHLTVITKYRAMIVFLKKTKKFLNVE